MKSIKKIKKKALCCALIILIVLQTILPIGINAHVSAEKVVSESDSQSTQVEDSFDETNLEPSSEDLKLEVDAEEIEAAVPIDEEAGQNETLIEEEQEEIDSSLEQSTETEEISVDKEEDEIEESGQPIIENEETPELQNESEQPIIENEETPELQNESEQPIIGNEETPELQNESELVTLISESEKIKVELSGEAGVIPEGTSLQVEGVSEEEAKLYLDAIQENTDTLIGYASLFDIHLLDEDGNEIQPNGEVTIKFQGLDHINPEDEVIVYHVEKLEAAENLKRMEVQASTDKNKVELEKFDTSTSNDGVSFKTNHFSIYVVGTNILHTMDYNKYQMHVGDEIKLEERDDYSNRYNFDSSDPEIISITTDSENQIVATAKAPGTASIRYQVGTTEGDQTPLYNHFYVNVKEPSTKPGTITTVDSKSEGIVTNLFDYHTYYYGADSENDINTDKDFKFNSGNDADWNKWTGYVGGGPYQGILQSNLGTDGYPVLNVGRTPKQSLNYLFDPDTTVPGKTVYKNVNHLLSKDDRGYYGYDSNKNYAYYDINQPNAKEGGDFIVYNKTYYTGEVPIGFFPFNEYDENETADAGYIPTFGYYNHFFGLTMEADFVMLPDGKAVNGDNMTFQFSGDDDAWVFIDDVLVLDIGGIHDPYAGSIDFQTGEVKINYEGGSEKAPHVDTTIKERFEAAGKEWKPSDYSEHNIKFFYLERGANLSNMKVDINLPTYPKNDFEITKEVTDPLSPINQDKEYEFQLLLNKGIADAEYEVYTGPATYKDTNEPVTYGEDGTFKLKANQTIIVPELIGIRQYQLKEVNVDKSRFDYVLFNDQKVEPIEENGKWSFISPAQTIKDSNFKVSVDNSVHANINVKKNWLDGKEKHSSKEVEFQFFDRDNKLITLDGQSTFTLNTENNWEMQWTDLPARVADKIDRVEEINVPKGYLASYEKVVDEGNKTIAFEIINTPEVIELSFIKTDENGEPLEGSEFTLEKRDGDNITYITNIGDNPIFIFENLSEGSYALTERNAPEGYRLPVDNIWEFEIIRDPDTRELSIEFADGNELPKEDGQYVIVNYPQSEFPATGGIGTAGFVIAGTTILLGSTRLYKKKNDL